MDRTSLSCAWLGAPHKRIYDQGGSHKQIYHQGYIQDQNSTEQYRTVQNNTEHYIPGPLQEHSHKQSYDQGAYVPTSRITTRELAG